jgi:hypothetical protein
MAGVHEAATRTQRTNTAQTCPSQSINRTFDWRKSLGLDVGRPPRSPAAQSSPSGGCLTIDVSVIRSVLSWGAGSRASAAAARCVCSGRRWMPRADVRTLLRPSTERSPPAMADAAEGVPQPRQRPTARGSPFREAEPPSRSSASASGGQWAPSPSSPPASQRRKRMSPQLHHISPDTLESLRTHRSAHMLCSSWLNAYLRPASRS